MLGCVGRFKYFKYKRSLRTENNLSRCKPLTSAGRSAYVELYGTKHEVANLSKKKRAKRLVALETFEHDMSFAEMVYLRRDARQWLVRMDAPSTTAEASSSSSFGSASNLETNPHLKQRREVESAPAITESGDW